jgi:hypothetical protein
MAILPFDLVACESARADSASTGSISWPFATEDNALQWQCVEESEAVSRILGPFPDDGAAGLDAWMRTEIAKWAHIVREGNLKAE